MNRTDYLVNEVLNKVEALRERRVVKPDHISRGREDYAEYLQDQGLDIVTSDIYSDAASEYIAAALSADGEKAIDMFNENEDLKEVTLDYYTGKHDRVRTIVSRETVNEDEEVQRGSMIIEHTRSNPHIEGVRRLVSAYADVIFTND